MMQRDSAGAYKVLNARKVADPKSVLVHQVLAKVYLAEKSPKAAMDELNTALAKQPKNATTLIALGDLHGSRGEWKPAMDRYQQAMAIDRTDTTAALRIGDAWIAQGNRASALAAYRGVLSTEPANVVASNNVAFLLLDDPKNQAEALRFATAAKKGGSHLCRRLRHARVGALPPWRICRLGRCASEGKDPRQWPPGHLRASGNGAREARPQ